MGCAKGCIKAVLITLNTLFWIFGLGLLGIGVWLKVDTEVANLGEVINIGLDQDVMDIASWILIGTGIFVFIVGFVGCCGAIRESPCLLGFYMVSLVLVFGAEVGIAIFVGVNFNALKMDISDATKNWLVQDYDADSVASKGFNYLQLEFCCCGVEDYRDYKDSAFLKMDSQIKEGVYMSFACCKQGKESEEQDQAADGYKNLNAKDRDLCEAEAKVLSLNSTAPPSVSDQCKSSFRAEGCKDALLEWGEMRMPILIGVGAGVAFVQIFVFAITVCLCRNIQGRKED